MDSFIQFWKFTVVYRFGVVAILSQIWIIFIYNSLTHKVSKMAYLILAKHAKWSQFQIKASTVPDQIKLTMFRWWKKTEMEKYSRFYIKANYCVKKKSFNYFITIWKRHNNMIIKPNNSKIAIKNLLSNARWWRMLGGFLSLFAVDDLIVVFSRDF